MMNSNGFERLYRRAKHKAFGVAGAWIRRDLEDVEDALHDAAVDFLATRITTDRDITTALFVRKTRDRASNIARQQRRRWHRQRPIGLFQPREEFEYHDDSNEEREAALPPRSRDERREDAALAVQRADSASGDEQHEPGVEDIPRIEATIRWAEATLAKRLRAAREEWAADLRSSRPVAVARRGRRGRPPVLLAPPLFSHLDVGDWDGGLMRQELASLQALLDRLRDEAAADRAIPRCDERRPGQDESAARVGGIGMKGRRFGLMYRRPRRVWHCPGCSGFRLTFGREHAHGRACPLAGHPVPMIHGIEQRGLIQASRDAVHQPAMLDTFTPKPEHTPGCAPGRAPRPRASLLGDPDPEFYSRAWTIERVSQERPAFTAHVRTPRREVNQLKHEHFASHSV